MKAQRGQAMTETLLVLPLLSILAFGLVQFAVFFSAKSAFEYACGRMAREYASGKITNNAALSGALWNALGSYQPFFDGASLRLSGSAWQPEGTRSFQNLMSHLPGPAGSTLSKTQSLLFNYGGQVWTVSLRYHGLPFARLFFQDGVLVQTQLAVFRYPIVATP